MTGSNLAPAEVFPPGEFIREELDARGWTQRDLARIMQRPEKSVSQIVQGNKQITSGTAVELAEAFGTSPELWFNLEAAYRLSLTERSRPDVARRARVYDLAPVNELAKRGWIDPDSLRDLDALEREVCRFLSLKSVDAKPAFEFAARASVGASTSAQRAWVCRARYLAMRLRPGRFSMPKARSAIPSIRRLSAKPQDVTKLPKTLGRLGIRLVFVPHLPRTKTDGACFWLDRSSPGIALSVRHDRIDNFWFTLMHELAHVLCRHRDCGVIVDNCLADTDGNPPVRGFSYEREADEKAAAWLIPTKEFDGFVKRTEPYFGCRKIEEFASTLHIHPGIVNGRLQFEKNVPYGHRRKLLEKVRQFLQEAGLMDAVR